MWWPRKSSSSHADAASHSVVEQHDAEPPRCGTPDAAQLRYPVEHMRIVASEFAELSGSKGIHQDQPRNFSHLITFTGLEPIDPASP